MNVVIPHSAQPVFPYVGFVAGTMITCKVNGKEETIAVEQLKPGMLVKVSTGDFRPVDKMGSRVLNNPSDIQRIANRLYVLPKANYPSLTADLTMAGNSAVLVADASDAARRQMVAVHGVIRVTDKRFCLPCAADAKAALSPLTGNVTIYNFSLNHPDKVRDYGIYANGLEVASSNLPHMLNPSYSAIH
jgi:hypothetical protein